MTDLDFLLNETPPHLHETIKRLTQVSPDSNVEKNREMLLQRSIVGLARRSFAFDRREVDVKVDFWKKNQGYITHSIFELEE